MIDDMTSRNAIQRKYWLAADVFQTTLSLPGIRHKFILISSYIKSVMECIPFDQETSTSL